MKRTLLALALSTLTLPIAAHAEEAAHVGGLSYTYIEAGYARVDFDGIEVDHHSRAVDFSGRFLRGSVELGESFYLFGGYVSGDNDDFGVDIDFNQLQAGVGYRFGLSEHVDLLSEISYLKEEIDISGHSPEKEDGYRASVGVRGLLTDRLEGFVKANYTRLKADGHEAKTSFGGTVAAEFLLNHTWRLVGEVGISKDVSEYAVGVRAAF